MKLESIVNGLGNLQARLDHADSIKTSSAADVDNIMTRQFIKLSGDLQKELKRLVDESRSSTNSATTSTVQQALYQSTQTMVTLLNSLTKMSTDADKSTQIITGGIGNTASKKEVTDLSKQLMAVGLQIDSLPTQFPIPKDTDLSGLSRGITELKTAISGIKIPEMPKTVDVTPQLKAMEARMGKRVVEFDVIRDMNGLIEKIVVTEGNI